MATVTVYSPHVLLDRTFVFGAKAADLVREKFKDYAVTGKFETNLEGQAAAEEAFDLTNNPDREEEREQLYGRGHSVSSGDVVDVDGAKYICMSIGWAVF